MTIFPWNSYVGNDMRVLIWHYFTLNIYSCNDLFTSTLVSREFDVFMFSNIVESIHVLFDPFNVHVSQHDNGLIDGLSHI